MNIFKYFFNKRDVDKLKNMLRCSNMYWEQFDDEEFEIIINKKLNNDLSYCLRYKCKGCK